MNFGFYSSSNDNPIKETHKSSTLANKNIYLSIKFRDNEVMSEPSQPPFIQVFNDQFQFVEAKKYLKIKGPLLLKVVHDHMYPLFRFSHELTIVKPKKLPIKKGSLICFWSKECFHPCILLTTIDEETKTFKIAFLKEPEFEISKEYDVSALLGVIQSPRPGPIDKFKILRRVFGRP